MTGINPSYLRGRSQLLRSLFWPWKELSLGLGLQEFLKRWLMVLLFPSQEVGSIIGKVSEEQTPLALPFPSPVVPLPPSLPPHSRADASLPSLVPHRKGSQ